jgi:hypothetical protein
MGDLEMGCGKFDVLRMRGDSDEPGQGIVQVQED